MNERFLPSVGARISRGRRWLYPALGILLFALFVPAARAQTNRTQALSSNRWLLIVDTSHIMQRRAESIRQVVGTLLVGGMKGQMRRGDTVGLWTYDAEPHIGKFPVQTWTPESSRDLARHVVDFLKAQKFEKESRLDLVVPRWNLIVSNSEVLTIILISAGEEKISGTPFDDAINDIYQGWQQEQEKARMPFITILRAEHGRITNQRVNTPPWPFEMPPLPLQPQATKVPDKVAAPSPVPGPLYFSGRKPALSQTQDVSQPEGITAPPAVPLTNSSTTGTENTSPVTETTPATAPENAAEIPKALMVADTAKVVEPATQPVGKPEAGAAAAMVSSPKLETAASPVTRPQTDAAASARSNAAVAQVAALTSAMEATSAAPAGTFLQRKVIWIGALVLAGVVLVLIWMMLRRSRSTAPVSLITRSLDREKK